MLSIYRNKQAMGFPARSNIDDTLYRSVIPRLLNDESIVQLAKEFKGPANKLRNWKSRAKKRLKVLEDQGIIQSTDTLENDASQQPAIQLEAVASEHLRSFLGDQAVAAMTAISVMRSEIPEVLSDLNKLIISSIEGFRSLLAAGESTKTTTFQGSITHCLAPLTINDRATIASAIKTLRHDFACLNNLPSEPLKIATLEVQTKQLAAAQHLHLHSHGSRKIVPRAMPLPALAAKAPAIDVTPEPAQQVGPELEEWQLELIRG